MFIGDEPDAMPALLEPDAQAHEGMHVAMRTNGYKEEIHLPGMIAAPSRPCFNQQQAHYDEDHYHHPNGPRQYGRTTSYALAQLVRPRASRWEAAPVNPEQHVTAGSIGLLDTETGVFEYIDDVWLADVKGDDLDLAGLVASAS